ncbi:MAG: histidinol-phosphate transaminase [Planctomycetota bacterium]|nr:histidinol-phosphate transaminase [Planctomycetota bacterium]MDA1179506.1 histidinol-phosphate transaminase [Planctomycetota bacterium]
MSKTGVRSHIESLQGYAPGEQPQASKYLKLNTNENPYPPSPQVEPAVLNAVRRGLERYPDPLATAFRIQAGLQHNVPPEWILCGNGSDDILTIVTRAMVGEGDYLRLPHPSYVLYRTLAQLQNAKYQEVQFDRTWNLPAAFTSGTPVPKLAFLPNPNSPSGTMLRVEQVDEIAQQLPCPLLIDEAYVDFAETHCIELVRRHAHVMVSRTLSKSYALAGLRFGYLIAQPSLIQQLIKVKDSYNCDALSIAAATAAISDPDWLNQNRQRIIEQRERLTQAMRQRGFDVPNSQANFVWCEKASTDLKQLYEKLKENRVLVRYMRYEGWPEGIRISVGTAEQMDALLAILDTIQPPR